jgi:cytosine/adenosine deaminase-related metal-dependent hydrolase
LIAERGNQLRRGTSSAVLELNEQGLLDDRILAVHGNYLNHEEIKLLARKKISVVHCPLSHRYFGHRPFPLQEALAAGINVALGTDSLASAASLSMLEVLRQVRNNFPDLSYEDIFRMATMGGAKALKLEKEIGEIIPGKKADIVGIPLAGKSSPLDALFSAEQVGFSMINGVIRVR